MSQQTNEPLRGEAAFRAAKERVQKANEAAYARGREERAAEPPRPRASPAAGAVPEEPQQPHADPAAAAAARGWRGGQAHAGSPSTQRSYAQAVRVATHASAHCERHPTTRRGLGRREALTAGATGLGALVLGTPPRRARSASATTSRAASSRPR